MPEPTVSENQVNPVGMLWDIAYNFVANITGIIGLTPLQFLMVLGGLLVVALVVTWARANFTDQGWSFDERTPNEGDSVGGGVGGSVIDLRSDPESSSVVERRAS